ncbi:helix-turn-helix domain-containing protein [Bordetella genomosp. 6]|uniref:helix-turn-helix domain-containing protein n=1 Tax=Bordetella genomosp. 6 TaxID=463024 RepID=UPI000A28F8B6|nr:helix-turn-helix transcriptional regulator [Bordetella genomosp. 6]ARP76191.1 transcriptional regulator [Bordetella genomosp. 6]
MTQDSVSAATPAAIAPGAAAPTVGSALRTLRQAKGWSLEEVSSRIKFSTRMIQALEEERWEALPKGVSLRGLVRNYARMLGADAQAVVDSLDLEAARAPAPARLAPRGGQGLRPAGVNISVDDERSSGSWGWLLAILVVVAAGVAYAFWQGWLPQEWLPAQWFSPVTQ